MNEFSGTGQADIDRLTALLEGSQPLPGSIGEHIRTRQLELAASLAGRVSIYLDSRFWIDLRRAGEGDGVSARALPLLMALRDAVAAGRAFCPISSSTFVEMLKHSDPAVRRRTAALVDELSLGVTVVAIDELLDAEIRAFIDDPGDHPLDALKEPIWTRLAYSLGTISPTIDGMGEREMLAIQTVGFDSIWGCSLEEIAATVPEPMRPDFAGAAERMTADSARHVHEIPTFEDAYRAEVAPMARMGAPLFAAHLRRKAAAAGMAPPVAAEQDLLLYGNVIRNALVLGKARQALRSAHIRTALHAIIRHNKGRRFKPNDIFDIEHAVCGIGYCGAFFTEGSLGTAATQQPLRLDQLYGCYVTSDVEAATRHVQGLT